MIERQSQDTRHDGVCRQAAGDGRGRLDGGVVQRDITDPHGVPVDAATGVAAITIGDGPAGIGHLNGRRRVLGAVDLLAVQVEAGRVGREEPSVGGGKKKKKRKKG